MKIFLLLFTFFSFNLQAMSEEEKKSCDFKRKNYKFDELIHQLKIDDATKVEGEMLNKLASLDKERPIDFNLSRHLLEEKLEKRISDLRREFIDGMWALPDKKNRCGNGPLAEDHFLYLLK